MKAFIAAMLALVAITVIADAALNRAGFFSSAEMYRTGNVRLDD